MSKVFFGYADSPHMNWNSSFWRCALPAKSLPGHEVTLAHLSTIPQFEDHDVFFVERCLFNPYLQYFKGLRAKGKKVFCTFDDNYDLIPKFMPGYKYWAERHEEFTQGIGEVDGALVPSRLLQTYYTKHGNVHLVENYFPDEWYDAPVNPEPEFELGLSCSVSHIESIKHSHLIDALKRSDFSMLLNAGQAHILMDALSGLYKEYVPWTRQQDYPATVDRFGIGLAPLAGEYDRYRSNIKVLLYNVRGRPFVASRSDPYLHMFGGVTVENNAEDWLRGIEKAKKDYSLLSEIGREQALAYRMSVNIHKYEELIG